MSNSEDLSSTGFPASTFCLRLGADVGSLVFGQRSADDKGDVKAERFNAFATDKIFLLHSVFYRCRALPFPPHRLPVVALETKPTYSEL